MRRKINLLYDGTLLTDGLNKGAYRSGIFMVVYHVFCELLTQKRLKVILYCPAERLEGLKLFISSYLPKISHKIEIINDPAYCVSMNRLDKKIEQVRARKNLFCEHHQCIRCQMLRGVLLILKATRKIIRNIQTILFPASPPVTWDQLDAALSPAFAHIPEVVQRKKIKRYTILYDTIPYIFPDLFPETITGKSWNLDLLLQLGAGDVCFAISEQTRKDYLYFSSLLRKYNNNWYRLFKSREGLPYTKSIITALQSREGEKNEFAAETTCLQPENIEIIPLAAAKRFFPERNPRRRNAVLNKYNIPLNKKYIFSLCTLEKRKNLTYAIRNFLALVREKKIDDLIFVLGGGFWSSYQVELDELLNSSDAGKLIYRIGYVDDDDVAALFSNALCTVYPSIYEGFGLPVLEAMQCGCPVIASNSSSIPEVMGKVGIQIDISSDQAMRDSIYELYSSAQTCRILSSQGIRQAKKFSWTKVGKLITDRICKGFNSDHQIQISQ